MDEHADARGPHIRSESNDIARLQAILARRVLLIFAFPLLVIMALGVYAYRLSAKVDTMNTVVSTLNTVVSTLNTLQAITSIEQVMQKSQSHEWALQQYEKLANANPHPEVLVRLGALYHADGRPEEALKRLDQAQEMEPTYWAIYSTRAYIYWSQEEVREAINAGEEALRLNPYDAQTHYNLALMYAGHDEVRDLAKAQDYAAKAVQYTRGFDADALDLLIDVYIAAGDLDRAMETTERAINRIDSAMLGADYFHERLNTLRESQTSVRNE
jgi:tetratricopeptide (TPR) repeat protein